MPVIGFLSSRSPSESASAEAAFREGLKEAGYIEGQNLHIAFRWADGQFARLPPLAEALVDLRVAVIVAVGGVNTAFAAKSATATIPIVFVVGVDPVANGLVASLNQPGGNLTGITNVSAELEAKRLGLLRELVPSATSIAVLVNPTRPGVDAQVAQAQQGARVLGLPLHIVNASSERDLDAVFVTLVQLRGGALMITADGLFADRLDQIAALAGRYSVPAMFQFRQFAAAGGLISYGSGFGESLHQAGILAGRILRGEKPTDLPVRQPTKFELVINMKTAKALGIEVPISMQMLADEVIE